ncbi:MAG: sodium:proton antiporter [Gemmatimonadaceae bacterium]
MTSEGTFVILFSVATGVAIAARQLRIPYTVALVVVGLALGSFQMVDAPHLTRELLYAVFLPGLLFDASFQLDAREFWHNRMTIGSLAVPGVVVGIGFTALIVTAVIQGTGLDPNFTLRYGLLFGALIAATDPIAVVGLFRNLNAPERLRLLLEGESLINDGTAIVALTLILAFLGGTATSAGGLLLRFVTIVGGGAAVGAAIGFGASRVIARIDDAMIEITLTMIAAYGSFVLGEQLHFSGVIATVTAGMICGSYGRRIGMSPSTQLAVQTFWDYLAFALNSVIFLLIGFEVSPVALLASWAVITIAFVAVIVSRGGVILLVAMLLRRTHEVIPRQWSLALAWGGLRGALSMVLALSLSADFPGRALMVTMTFGVVVASILIQGLTMPVVLRRLGLVNQDEGRLAYEIARGRLQVSTAVAREIDRMRATESAPPDLLDQMSDAYTARRTTARSELSALNRVGQQLREKASADMVEHILLTEKSQLLERVRTGLLRRDAFDELAKDVDERLVRLRTRDYGDVMELVKIKEPVGPTESASSANYDDSGVTPHPD